jgi:UDPglucose 6-dehydrogenase
MHAGELCGNAVGIIGLGSVGSSMMHALSKYWDCKGYDVIGGREYDWNEVIETSIIFICVPTPAGNEGRLDCSCVEDVLTKLDGDGYKGIIVIKSTLKIGFLSRAENIYPSLKIVYMPEFLREINSFSWGESPDRIVISGKDEDVDSTLLYFHWLREVPVLRMTHIEAEIGKIAHNAYIATKVSFTNAIEMISEDSGADPGAVMSVIWADRRVKSKAHLVPGLGGYAGKCIPKDSEEINAFQKERGLGLGFFDEIGSINRSVHHSKQGLETKVHVIIPTAQQDRLIHRAYESVKRQSLKPETVIIVYDKSEGFSEYLQEFVSCLREAGVHIICNERSQNLSGAINTGLVYLHDFLNADDSDFVAILDDDDYWDYRYLQNCITFSSDFDCDWVISGIIRHDSENLMGIKQTIPESVSQSDFYVGNPNIQGSNLFIRMNKIMGVGGFSEDLVSTTDRDICIRLLDLDDIKIGSLRNHMVHHDCTSRSDRLSKKYSEKKTLGLIQFYKKYAERMSVSERDQFIERAERLFGAEKSIFINPKEVF